MSEMALQYINTSESVKSMYQSTEHEHSRVKMAPNLKGGYSILALRETNMALWNVTFEIHLLSGPPAHGELRFPLWVYHNLGINIGCGVTMSTAEVTCSIV